MDSRDIQGPSEGFRRRDGAMELQVEVLRCETVQVHGRILQQRPGEDGPVLQGSAVQERLQDAAGAARRRGDVHFGPGSGALRGRITHIGNRFAASDVQDNGGQVRNPTQRQFVRPACGRILDLPLQVDVDAGARLHPMRHVFYIMAGQGGQGIGGIRQWLREGAFQCGCIDISSFVQPFQQSVPLLQQAVAALAGMDGGRSVRKDGECGGFGPGKLPGRATEIAPGRGV